MAIEEFYVKDPQKSGEVRERVAKALRDRNVLSLVLASYQEVPPVPDMPISFAIRQLQQQPEGGSATITGSNEDYDSIVVRVDADPEKPASASLVTG